MIRNEVGLLGGVFRTHPAFDVRLEFPSLQSLEFAGDCGRGVRMDISRHKPIQLTCFDGRSGMNERR